MSPTPSSSPPSSPYFKVTHPDTFITHVEINRPNKLNSFCHEMWADLKAIFDYYSYDPDTRAVIISGAGDRAFTSGLDVAVASSPDTSVLAASRNGTADASRRAVALRRHIAEYQEVISSVARCEKPVIALLHGYTFGLGIDLSSACDIRICLEGTKFCVKEVDIGLAADVGTLSRLPKIMGLTSFVKEICLTARVFTPEEALANNFVSRIVKGKKEDLIAQGLETARLLVSKSPVAVMGTKNILDAAWGRTVEDNLNYTAVWNASMLQSSDVERAMTSGLRKQGTPRFEKL